MEYLLKVSAVIMIFYGCYQLFLQRNTFFEHNRWFLLLGLLTAFVIPFVVIPIYIEYTPLQIPDFTVNESNTINNTSEPVNMLYYLTVVYGLGVVLCAVRFLIQLVSLFFVLRKTKGYKKERYTFIETDNNIAPFSFFKWIIYNPNNFNETELEQIITHEKTHASQYHSIDILLSQFSCVVLWFNPFIWLYSKNIKQNLEFIADRKTQSKFDNKSYQITLLKTTAPSHHMALTNNFYNSLIKKRIIMLHKSKSKKINLVAYALVIPVLIAFLISCNGQETTVTDANSELAEPVILSIDKNKQPLIVVDGNIMTQAAFKSLDQNSIYSVNVLKDENFTKKYGDKGKNGVVEIITKENVKLFEGTRINAFKSSEYGAKSDSIHFNLKVTSETIKTPPLMIVDGKELPQDALQTLDPDNIQSINVLKDETATKKYGEKGKNGVMEVTTKK